MTPLLIFKVWLPQGVSRAMGSAAAVALSLHFFALTGSPLLLSSVLAASFLASIYLSPLVGGLADHVQKRVLLLVGNLLLGAAALIIGFAASTPTPLYPLIFAIILASGALDAIVAVTQQAAIGQITADKDLVRANALVTFLQNSPLIVGPVLGAALYAQFSFFVVAALNASSFVLAGLAALFLPITLAKKPAKSWLKLPFSGAREGFSHLWRDRDMRGAQLWYSLANFGNGLAAGIVAAFILSAVASQGGDGKMVLGWFGTAGAVGLVVCALILGFVKNMPWRAATLVLAGLAGAALLGRLPLIFCAGVIAFCAVSFARSFFLELSNAPLLAIWQKATSREIQGRVFGARRMLAQAPYPLAMWIGGLLAEFWPREGLLAWLHLDPMAAVILLSTLVELLAFAGLFIGRFLQNLEDKKHFPATQAG
ncbi:MAG: MFS transporter [Microbacteriaceae bacterium]|nr:MFS transporter [Microbacteriaceae bacterium]